MTTITISGPIPSGLPNAGTQGTNSISIDDSLASQAFIAAYLYEINFRPTIPDPNWTSMITVSGVMVQNPDPQGQVPNDEAPGKFFLEDLWRIMIEKATRGAAKLDQIAVNEAMAAAARTKNAIDSLNPVVE